MNLTIAYFRGIINAALPLTRLTLVAGINHQGKSSIAAAAAALLTGEALPPWCKKKDAGQMVNATSGVGRIALEGPDGSTVIEYPSCKASSAGVPPHASRVAVGMESPLDMPDRDRARFFADLLHTEPTEADLRTAVHDADLTEKEFADLWRKVQSVGWDAAHGDVKQRGAEAKGAWQHVTGDNYGVSKGESWAPEGYSPARHDRLTLDGIAASLTTLRAERDAAVGQTAMDAAEEARLQQYADGYDTAKATHNDNVAAEKKLVEQLTALRAKVPELLRIDDQPCPACSAALTIRAGKIVTGGTISQEDVKKSETAAKAHRDKVAALEEKLASIRQDVGRSHDLLAECETARRDLKDYPAMASEPSSGCSVDQIEADITVLETERDIITIKAEAAALHVKVKRYLTIVNALAPEGLRAEALTRGLSGMNESLLDISNTAGWGRVILNDDLSICFDGRPYPLLSQSELFRVRVTLQIAIAGLDGSQAVVIDGADILDRAGRNGLVSAVLSAEIPALVCMTIARQEDMPDMSAVGGCSVWVEAGEVAAEVDTSEVTA